MMRRLYPYILLAFLFAFGQNSFCQDNTIGEDVIIKLENETIFFFGNNTTLGGSLINNGQISTDQSIDFVENEDVGSLKFIGTSDQNILGDTLHTQDFVVDKSGGEVTLETGQIIVEGSLSMTEGVVNSPTDLGLIVTGSSGDDTDMGFVTGNLVGLTTDRPLFFPMGINGNPNYITLTTESQGATVRVHCQLPETERLVPTEEMIGIADEVEWVLTTDGEPIEVIVTTTFTGVDLTEFSNGRVIRAQDYLPTLVKLGAEDTVYQDLGIGNLENTDDQSFGTITASRSLTISNEPTYLGVALVPILLRPEFYVPNAFSPFSLLEENKKFRPYFAGAEITFVSIKVWDDLQKELYSINDSGNDLDLSIYGWDGILPNGNYADEGVYYYGITISAGGVEYKKIGSFLLSN